MSWVKFIDTAVSSQMLLKFPQNQNWLSISLCQSDPRLMTNGVIFREWLDQVVGRLQI